MAETLTPFGVRRQCGRTGLPPRPAGRSGGRPAPLSWEDVRITSGQLVCFGRSAPLYVESIIVEIGSSATLGADHTSSVSVSPSSMSRFRSVSVCCPSLSVLVGRDLVLGHTVSTVYRRCYDSGKTYPALLVCRPVVRVLS